jgi:hypothetical protein
VPFMVWIEDIISPSHHFTVLNSSTQSVNFVWNLCISILCGWGPTHKRTFIGSCSFKLDDPVLSYVLIIRMIMNVFLLWLIDSGNSVSLFLVVPYIWLIVGRSTCLNIIFWSLENSNHIWVLFHVKS